MFTGIVQAIGHIQTLQPQGGDLRLAIQTGKLDLSDVQLGDSIAVNGVCLTVIELGQQYFAADVSRETMTLTSLAGLNSGASVNLEKALTLATRLGGHLVSGHVDGLGEVLARYDDARSVRFRIQAPDALAKYIAAKGSICVDGTSLTVNRIDGAIFELNIVPHTLQETIMAGYQVGSKVNLEVDVIARYLERLLLAEHTTQATSASSSSSHISEAFLAEHGFLK
ncbi:MAG: riboflavin synthase [bacterium]